MLLTAHTLLVVAGVAFLLAALKVKGKTAYSLAFFLLSFGVIVFIFTAASLIRSLSGQTAALFEALVLGCAILFWSTQGKPPLFEPFRDKDFWRSLRSECLDVKRSWPLLLLVCAALFILAITGLIAWFTSDSFGDTMRYHYPRIALWLQNKTIFFNADTAAFITDERIIGTERNADILYGWIFLGTGSIRFANIIEWIAIFPAMISIYGIARQLGGKQKSALLAAITYLTYETVIWNMGHANAVLSSTTPFLAGLYFLIRADRDRDLMAVIFTCIGFALALGAKATVFFLSPILLIGIVIIIARGVRTEGKRWLILWLAAGGLSLLVFTAPTYIQNLVTYGGPLASISGRENSPIVKDFADYFACGRFNLLRYLYTTMQPRPLPVSWEESTLAASTRLWRAIGSWLNTPLDSSFCVKNSPFTVPWIGNNLLYFPFMLIAPIFSIKRAKKEGDFWRPFIWALWVGFFIIFSLVMNYHSWHFRYFAFPAAIFAILLADLFDKASRNKWVWAAIILITAASGIVFTIRTGDLSNGLTRSFQTIINDKPNSYHQVMDGYFLPDTAVLAVVRDGNITDAVLWGDAFSREVTFTGCDELLTELGQSYDTIAYLWVKPENAFSRCLASYQQTDGTNALQEMIDQSYTTVYEAPFLDFFMAVLQKDELLTALPVETLRPSAFPPLQTRVHIFEPFTSLGVSAGPVLINSRVDDEPNEIAFSLQALEANTQVHISAELFGDACSAQASLLVKQVDQRGDVIAEHRVATLERIDSYREILFDAQLEVGINRFVLDDEPCGDAIETPLYLSRVMVAPEITGAGISLAESGFFGLEVTPEGDSFRWVNDNAGLVAQVDQPGDFTLTLGAMSDPGRQSQSFIVEILDSDGVVLTEISIPEAWGMISAEVAFSSAGEHHLTMRIRDGSGDPYAINFLLTDIILTPVE